MKDTYSPSSSCPEITFLPSPALSLPPLPQHPLPMDPLWSSPITYWKSFSRWPVQCQIQPLMVPPLNCPTKLYPLHFLWLIPQYSESSSQDPVLCPLSLFLSLCLPGNSIHSNSFSSHRYRHIPSGPLWDGHPSQVRVCVSVHLNIPYESLSHYPAFSRQPTQMLGI